MKINANWVVIKVPVTGEGFNVFNPAPGKFGRIGHRRKKSKRHDECSSLDGMGKREVRGGGRGKKVTD